MPAVRPSVAEGQTVMSIPLCIPILFLAFIAGTVSVGRAQAKAQPHEQTRFSSEEEAVSHPVSVPNRVVQLLKEAGAGKPEGLRTAWLQASEIHLGRRREADLIVMGVGGLRGANIVPFWVFIRKDRRYKLGLHVRADALNVLESRTKGYRDIRTLLISMKGVYTRTWRFDGQKYVAGPAREEQAR